MNIYKSVSSKDVAKEAGVSQATVSYVLNDVQGIKIKPETKEAVLAAAKRLNYHPNHIAKSMRLKKAMSIGVVSDKNISNFWFVKVLEGIKDALATRNHTITLCVNKSPDIEQTEHIKYFVSNRIDGIIFAFSTLEDSHIDYLLSNSIPFVQIHSNVGGDMVHLVKTDMSDAILRAVEHLLKRGRRKFAYFGTAAGNIDDRRFAGYKKALDFFKVEGATELLLSNSWTYEELECRLGEFFTNIDAKPDAILCDNADMGFNFLKYAAKKSISVPDQIAVVAIGTSRFSQLSYPSLSAIEAPLYDMGFKGTEMLFDIVKNNNAEDVVVLEWSFVNRDSS